MENLLYLLAACLLIIGLKMLSSPKTAVRGNALGAIGMLIAAAVALLLSPQADAAPGEITQVNRLTAIGIGLLAGTLVGIIASQKVQMTAMPQLVALFNGFGGLASVIVAGAMLLLPGNQPSTSEWVATALTGIVGSVTFLGSTVAFGKLQELDLFKNPRRLPFPHVVNSMLFVALIGLSILMIYNQDMYLYVEIVLVA